MQTGDCHWQHLRARLGELRGVLIDDHGARRTTIDAAISPDCGALFIAEGGELALLVPEIGPPAVCGRRAAHE